MFFVHMIYIEYVNFILYLFCGTYSIIGAMIMVGGVYLVIWCKMKEAKSAPTTADHVETNKNIKEVNLANLPAVNNRDVP